MAMASRARPTTPDQPTPPNTPRVRSTRRERPMIASRTASTSLSFPLFVGAVHWIIVQLSASLAYHYGRSTGTSKPQSYTPNQLGSIVDFFVGPMRRWDGLWYALIADQGY